MAYRIINQVLGTTITVATLPDGVRVGVTDIGPCWNNSTPPQLIVEEINPSRRRVVIHGAVAWVTDDNQAIWERGSKATP